MEMQEIREPKSNEEEGTGELMLEPITQEEQDINHILDVKK